MAKWSGIAKSIRVGISKHSPEILTGMGIAGMGFTVISAVKATPKALQIIEEEKPETKLDVIKATWRCYIPTIVSGVASAACIIGANSVNARRNAALAAAYNISQAALIDYKDKVLEHVGEAKEQVIRESIAKDKIDKNPVKNTEVLVTDKGDVLCYDLVFGRYFKSNRDNIQKAENRVNRTIVTDMYACLNDFYEELGLPPTEIGYELGWNIDDREIRVEYSSVLGADGTPCLAITYNVAPRYNYSKFF
jgi:hypothetical protein